MLTDSQTKNQCCGCRACSQICPTGAIEMKTDNCGFAYPDVDKDKCINCHLCTKVCPMEVNYVGEDCTPNIYALKNKSKETVSESSSGGMFSLIAQWIFDNGGVVYGVAFDDDFHVSHMRADSMETAKRFRTSKYVESNFSSVFKSVITDLNNGLLVLVTGTPCQISSLNNFLKLKNINTEKLYTCDNVCHGVPSPMVWDDYLDILRNKYIEDADYITSINMRSKKTAWRKQDMSVELSDGNLDDVTADFSFNKIFLSLNANRPACFNCRYTSYKRPADFSLADFWNVDSAGIKFDCTNGVNEVLVNTKKGNELFALIKNGAQYQPVSKKDSWQPHLEYSAKMPKSQPEFWNEYNSSEDKEAVLHKYIKGTPMTKLIHTLSPILRKTGLYKTAGQLYKKIIVRK